MSLALDMVHGAICSGCQMPFAKPNGFPAYCRECYAALSPRERQESGAQRSLHQIDFGTGR